MAIAVLRGQRLHGYILGTKVCPSEFTPTTKVDGIVTLQANKEFDDWVTIDQALLGWLYGSMTLVVASEVINTKTSRDVWKALEVLFGSTNKSRVNQLKRALQTTMKNGMKMFEYLSTMKQIGENLSLAREAISVSSLISSVLTGLDSEYLPIICQINGQGYISWHELHATLITFGSELINPSANYVAKGSDLHKCQNRYESYGQWRNQNHDQRGSRGK